MSDAISWLSLKEVADLGVPLRTLQYQCTAGKLTCRKVSGNGGSRYEIDINSLPTEIKSKYCASIVKDIDAPMTAAPVESDPETESNLIAAMTEWEQGFVSKFLISFIRENDISKESLSILKNIIDSLMSIISDHSSAEGKNV